jgi:alpha-ketoglutarate-dependent taurine dioxygenase
MGTEQVVDVVAEKDPGAVLDAARVTIPDSDIKVGPLGHLAAERGRLNALEWDGFEVRRMAATVGAEIVGLDLRRELSDEVFSELEQALLDYKVIFFRDQPLDAAQHLAFAQRFGALEIHPFIPSSGDHPELVRFAKSADVGGYENSWHHDVTWRASPSKLAVLRAVEVPASGGDTLFADAHAAWAGLDDDTRAKIAELDAVHDFMRAFGHQVPAEQKQEMRDQYPLVVHPVVCRHPVTGAELLYVNPIFTDHIVGMDSEESATLLGSLFGQFEQVEYQCRFQWHNDSIAVWDNRAVQHYANSDYWPDVRVMERASVLGDTPSRVLV